MTTIRDVARLAGVSVASVSNAINVPDRVSVALRNRVARAIEQLGYAPNLAARSLRSGSSRILGLLVADITNPFFTELVDVTERAAGQHGYAVILCNSAEDVEREERQLALLRAQRVDGLIVAPTGPPSRKVAALLTRLQVPVALLDRAFDGWQFDAVSLDNGVAARLAVDHAVGLGHRRIAIINGPSRLRTAADRLRGFREALDAHGLVADPRLIHEADFREDAAYRAARALLALEDRPSVVFATNSPMTIGLLRAVADAGLRCPQDVSVIGMDDLPWAEAFTPALTMVVQPVRRMAEAALGLVLDRLGGLDGAARLVVERPRLVVRQSCVAPAAHR